MSFLNRTRIAATLTLLVLGALAAVALASRPDPAADAESAAAVATTPEVRTQVERRTTTVDVTTPASGGGSSSSGGGSSSPGSSSSGSGGGGGGAPSAAAPAPAPAPAPAAPTVPERWVGRVGTEGAYDDLELTLSGGQLQITKPPLVPVVCLENGGGYASASSAELFDAPGPWTVGTDGSVEKSAAAVNQLVGSSPRTITYKVTGTSADATRIAGTLGMSFFESRYDVFTYTTRFINCMGSQSFEAVPAG